MAEDGPVAAGEHRSVGVGFPTDRQSSDGIDARIHLDQATDPNSVVDRVLAEAEA